MFELGITGSYFVGGIPTAIDNPFASTPALPSWPCAEYPVVQCRDVERAGFVGCITSLTLDADKVNLNEGSRASLGSEPGCPDKAVRVVEFPGSAEAGLSFAPWNVTAAGPLQLSLRFRTNEESGLLASMLDEAKVLSGFAAQE